MPREKMNLVWGWTENRGRHADGRDDRENEGMAGGQTDGRNDGMGDGDEQNERKATGQFGLTSVQEQTHPRPAFVMYLPAVQDTSLET